MIMSIKQKKIKLVPRIKLNDNINLESGATKMLADFLEVYLFIYF